MGVFSRTLYKYTRLRKAPRRQYKRNRILCHVYIFPLKAGKMNEGPEYEKLYLNDTNVVRREKGREGKSSDEYILPRFLGRILRLDVLH